MSIRRKPAAISSEKPATRKPKPPTLAEMRAVVRAWIAANHPDVEHATLSSHNRYGSGPELAEIIGPPTDKAWFTNDLPPTEEQEKEREAAVEAAVKKHRKQREQEDKILREADNIDPQRKVVEWIARWANATALLNALDEELQELAKAADRLSIVDRERVCKIELTVHRVATDALTMPFRGTLPLARVRKGGA
ncbi:MAG: hypothetical protein U0791_24340 [Gemmataceae bacterium]